MKTFVLTALFAAAMAVKMQQDEQNAELTNPWEDESVTSVMPPEEMYEDWMEPWGSLIEAQAYQVAQQAWENLENDPSVPALMETCEKGQQCRDEVD